MQAAGPRRSRFGVLKTELVALRTWSPFEFECRLVSIRLLVKKCRAIKRRRQLYWPHWPRLSSHGGHTMFPSKSSCNLFVHLIPVAMCVSGTRVSICSTGSVSGCNPTITGCFNRIVQLDCLLDQRGLVL